MKVAIDTNVIIRALTGDDAKQSAVARARMRSNDQLLYSIAVLCETVWVLRKTSGWAVGDIANAIRLLLNNEGVETDWALAEAGLTMLDAGGDFADGVIAADGRRLGASTFLTFDRKAAKLLEAQGESVTLL